MDHAYYVNMRTTLIIEDETYREAKAAAARLGTSVGSVVETALREYLASLSAPATDMPALVSYPGGPRPGIDIDRTSALLDALDADNRAQR
jgi:hypothetical protein